MNFGIGQRVKRIASGPYGIPLGATGTVLTEVYSTGSSNAIDIDWDNSTYTSIGVAPYTLAPLTDPGADAFLERIKKMKPEPEMPALPVKEKA